MKSLNKYVYMVDGAIYMIGRVIPFVSLLPSNAIIIKNKKAHMLSVVFCLIEGGMGIMVSVALPIQ